MVLKKFPIFLGISMLVLFAFGFSDFIGTDLNKNPKFFRGFALFNPYKTQWQGHNEKHEDDRNHINKDTNSSTYLWAILLDGFDEDEVYSIQETSDGGFITAGCTRSFGAGIKDALIVKLNSEGEVEWQKTYGTADWGSAFSIRQTFDGDFIVAGSILTEEENRAFQRNFWVSRLKPNGEIRWQKVYEKDYVPQPFNYDEDIAWSVEETNDGRFLVAGKVGSYGAGHWDFCVLKITADGEIEWQKTYGGFEFDYIRSESFFQTNDGGFIVAGNTDSFGAGRCDIWVLKLTADGDIEWQKTYGGPNDDEAFSIIETSDGGYILAGFGWFFDNRGKDMLILKLFSDGQIEWQKTFGGEFNTHEEASAIIETRDRESYVVIGEIESGNKANMVIMKLDSEGNLGDTEWQKAYRATRINGMSYIKELYMGGYILVTCGMLQEGNDRQILVMKLDSNGEIDASCGLAIEENNLVVSSSSYFSEDTYVEPVDSSLVAHETDFIVQNSELSRELLCSNIIQQPGNISLRVEIDRSWFKKCIRRYHVISWSPSTFTSEFPIDEYRVYRKTSGIWEKYQIIASIPANVFKFRDGPFDCESGFYFYYTVTAVDVNGNESPKSNPVKSWE